MRRLFAIAIVLSLSGRPAAAQAPPPASDLVHAALEAMGGEDRWRALTSIRVEGAGHEHALEQSERPAGPWLTTYRQFAELRDLAGGRLRRTQETRGFWQPEWTPAVTIADREAAIVERGGRARPALPNQHRKALQALDLAPERVLLTALTAPDLAAAGDTLLQGVEHRIVTFTWDGRPARLYLNAATRLPAAVALPEPAGEIFEAIWGDSPTLTIWSLWSLEPNGLLYPRQRDVFRLGHPLESELLSTVAFDAPAPADSFGIPAEQRTAFAAGPAFDFFALRPGEMPGSPEPAEAIELAPGVVTIPGVYATTWVEQADGVVVLEATMTSDWTRAVLEGAAERFAGKPVTAVVSTSDAWPHVGGVRGFVAAGIPVYALDLNLPLLERLLAAPHRRDPDALARSPRPADLRPVDGPTTIGAGPNRIVLHPVRGEGGERMMVAWLPERRILYASDLVQVGPDGKAFWPEYLLEVVAVVEREGLDPETVFAMHTPPLPWERVERILAEASGAAPPAARLDPAPFDPSLLVARSDSFAFRANGVTMGGQRLGLERTDDGWRVTESTRIADRMRQETTVLLDADLAPVSVRQSGRAMGDSMGVAVDYADGRVSGSVRTPSPEGRMEEKPVDRAVPDGVVDDNTLQALLPALPWAPDAAWSVPVFSAGTAEVRETVLRVAGVETVEAPAGTYEAYRVEVEREEAPAVFWVTTAAPHAVVKGGSLVAPIEFVLVESDAAASPPAR